MEDVTSNCEGKFSLYVFLYAFIFIFDMCQFKRQPSKGQPPSKFNHMSGVDTITAAVTTTKDFITVLRMLAGITPVFGPPVQALIDVTIVIVSRIEVRCL